MKYLASACLAVGILALVAPASWAQCAAARSFGGGGMAPRIVIDTTPFQDVSGTELAQIWESGNPANSTGVGTAGSCPSDGTGSLIGPWWAQGTSPHNMAPNRWITGFIASTGCSLPECPLPGGGITVLVEDLTADGSGAGFIVYQVDETVAAGSPKRYDHARTGSGDETTTHTMTPYPTVTITGSVAFPPPGITLSTTYNDVGGGIKAVAGPDDTVLPGSDVIDSYDLYTFHGASPPGRLRSEWVFVKSVAYFDTIIFDTVHTECGDFFGHNYFALGVTFDGVPSRYVGRPSLPIQCSPDIAEPDETKPPRPRLERRSSTSRGR